MPNRPSTRLALLLLPTLFLMPPPAHADNLTDEANQIVKLDQEGKKDEAYRLMTKMVSDYSQSLPFQIVNATFTQAIPVGFGAYDEHDGNAFSPTEPIYIYMETAGVKWVPTGDGEYATNITLGLKITSSTDAVIFEKPNVSTIAEKVHKVPNNFFAYFYLTNFKLPAGQYSIIYTLLDNNKHALAEVKKEIVIR